jgi:deoxyribose-phosphate aldolase
VGATTTLVKAVETVEAVKIGADEVDMVVNIGALKDRRLDEVLEDIASVVKAAHPKALVKVILETSDLTDEEKVLGCELAVKAGADFVKTSSGFGTGGATAEDVRADEAHGMCGRAKVKASTGNQLRADADNMIRAGAERLGTSKGNTDCNGRIAPVCVKRSGI